MDNNFLRDDWIAEGFQEKELLKILKQLDESTVVEEIDPLAIIIYSIAYERTKDYKSFYSLIIEPFHMTVEELFPIKKEVTYFSKGQKRRGNFPFSFFYKAGFSDELIAELRAVGYWLIYERMDEDMNEGKILMLPSAALLSTLSRQLGCSKLPDIQDPIREVFMGYLLRRIEEFTLVYRKGRNIAKAFAAMGKDFRIIPQTTVYNDCLSAIRLYCKCTVLKYRITHFLTEITFLLCDYQKKYKIGDSIKKVSAAVVLSFSDVGDASYSLDTVITVSGTEIYLEGGVVRNHKGSVSITALAGSFMLNMSDTLKKAFKLIDTVSQTPSYFRHDIYITLINKLKLDTVIGKKNSNILRRQILSEENRKVSPKEVLFEFLDLPGRINYIILSNDGKKVSDYIIKRLKMTVGRLFSEEGEDILWR